MNAEQHTVVSHAVASQESIILVCLVIAGLALASIVISWGITRFIKQWRRDHSKKQRLPSESAATASVLASVAFVGNWYVAHVFGIIVVDSTAAMSILAVFTGIMSPLSFNPLLAYIAGRWPRIAQALDPTQKDNGNGA